MVFRFAFYIHSHFCNPCHQRHITILAFRITPDIHLRLQYQRSLQGNDKKSFNVGCFCRSACILWSSFRGAYQSIHAESSVEGMAATSARLVILVISAILFGLIHVYRGPIHVIWTTIFGLIMAFSYYRFGRVFPLIFAHYLTNALQVIVVALAQ